MKAGVIGCPIKHSKSPIIHGHWMEQYNIDGKYQKIEIKPESLDVEIKRLINENYNGFNVTVPHKEEIFKLCDEVDEKAKTIGAVNTVLIKDKKLHGTNTDAFGFIQNLKESSNLILKDKSVLLLGAGGAARAIIYGLLDEGVSKVYISNRTRERAENLVTMSPNKIDVVDWDVKEDILNEIDLLVNSTSLGMQGQAELSINLSNLKSGTVVTDIVYSPLKTPLLQDAENRGHDVVTGLGMLLHQARPAFEAWTGTLPDVTRELQELVLA